MHERILMRVAGAFTCLLGMTSLPFMPAAQAQTVTLRVVSAFPTPLATNDMLRELVKRVDQESGGKIKINYLGGPEVITAPDQAQAIRTGVIDLLYGAANYYQGVVPEGDAIIASGKKPWEARANGGWKLLQDVHAKKMGTYLLGWPGANFPFYIYLRDTPKLAANGIPDLSNLKIRTTPIYREFLTAMNATPVVIQIPEVYTSLERGLVNGVGFPINTLPNLGWNKHLKYRISPGFFTGDLMLNANLAKWNSLPKDSRDLIEKIMQDVERLSYDFYDKLDKQDDEVMRKGGMEVLTLSPEAGKRYVAMANQVVWDRLIKNSPVDGPKLKALFE